MPVRVCLFSCVSLIAWHGQVVTEVVITYMMATIAVVLPLALSGMHVCYHVSSNSCMRWTDREIAYHVASS